MPANAAPRSSTSSSTAASAAFVRAAMLGHDVWAAPKRSRCWSGCRFRAGGVTHVAVQKRVLHAATAGVHRIRRLLLIDDGSLARGATTILTVDCCRTRAAITLERKRPPRIDYTEETSAPPTGFWRTTTGTTRARTKIERNIFCSSRKRLFSTFRRLGRRRRPNTPKNRRRSSSARVLAAREA